MKLVADLHTHTVASTHAYSTVHEMAQQAIQLGFQALAMTDHGIGMPDSPHRWYFKNMHSLPDVIDQKLLLLKGVEANVIHEDGSLDMPLDLLKRLDWVIASLHQKCIAPMNKQKATNLWLAVAENPMVDMIGHSEQHQYLYDYDRVTKAFSANNKVVELNANSALSRPGNEQNLRDLALCCMRNQTKVAINSDAHSIYSLGNQQEILEMLRQINFPEHLVLNADIGRFMDYLKSRKKSILKRVSGRFSVDQPSAG